MQKTILIFTLFFSLSLQTARSQDVQDSLSKQKFLFQLPGHADDVEVVVFSGNGKWIATGSWDKTIRIYSNDSADRGKLIKTLEGHSYAVTTLFFSRDSKFLISGSKDYMVKSWETGTWNNLKTFYGHKNNVNSVLIDPGNRLVISGSTDGNIIINDLVNPQGDRTIKNNAPVNSIVMSPDRKSIFCAGEETSVKQYDIKGNVTRTFDGHKDVVNSVDCSNNNKYLLTGSSDKTAILWDLRTGKEVRRFTGHTWKVTTVSFSMDSRYILTGSNDGTVKLWDVESGNLIYTYTGNGYHVRSANFSPEQKTIGIASLLKGSKEFGAYIWSTGVERQAPARLAPAPAAGVK